MHSDSDRNVCVESQTLLKAEFTIVSLSTVDSWQDVFSRQ